MQRETGFSDEYLRNLPYGSLLKKIEHLYKTKADEAKERMRLAAFTSYWQYAPNAGEKAMTMLEWFAQFNLNDSDLQIAVQSEEESLKVSEMVREAFKQKPMTTETGIQ